MNATHDSFYDETFRDRCGKYRQTTSIEFWSENRVEKCSREIHMNVSRKLGILVFCGVPAIVGGGILYAVFGNYIPVFIYELLLVFAAGSYVSR